MLAYNVKLNFEKELDKTNAIQTFNVHKNIWNYLSEIITNSKSKQKLNGVYLHRKTYKKCKKLFPDTPSQIIIRAREDVISTYKSLQTNIRKNLIDKDSVELPCKKENLSIRLDKRIFTIKENTISFTTMGKRAKATFNIYPKLQEMFDKYPVKDPLIFYEESEKQIWLSIPFDNSVQLNKRNYCVGVDLGIKRIAVTSEGIIISDKNYLKRKRRIRYLKRCLKAAKKKNRSDTARRHLKKLKRKERNINDYQIHKVANKILETKANTIVIEDLSLLKKQNKNKSQKDPNYKYKYKGKDFNNKRSQVPFYLIRKVLEYKAPVKGKELVTVNPYNTSKDDYRNIESGKRQGCRYYTSDSKVFDADMGASVTIALRFASKIKLPVSMVVPIDGKYGLNGQGAVSHPLLWCP